MYVCKANFRLNKQKSDLEKRNTHLDNATTNNNPIQCIPEITTIKMLQLGKHMCHSDVSEDNQNALYSIEHPGWRLAQHPVVAADHNTTLINVN